LFVKSLFIIELQIIATHQSIAAEATNGLDAEIVLEAVDPEHRWRRPK
jgi:hypothetical protein